jgi:AcrR family transcriptional regulator
LRDRRRIQAMRNVQATALSLFESRGFDRVTIEEIAAQAEVGPASVYRYFASKERIVLWDEYDPRLFDTIAAWLPTVSPVVAVREALIFELDRVYAADRDRILRRARLLAATPSLQTVQAADAAGMRDSLAKLFERANACSDTLEANVVAGAIVATLEAAIAHWVAQRGRARLRHVFTLAFRRLEKLVKPSPAPR